MSLFGMEPADFWSLFLFIFLFLPIVALGFSWWITFLFCMLEKVSDVIVDLWHKIWR
jgi:hypothetical protein